MVHECVNQSVVLHLISRANWPQFFNPRGFAHNILKSTFSQNELTPVPVVVITVRQTKIKISVDITSKFLLNKTDIEMSI